MRHSHARTSAAVLAAAVLFLAAVLPALAQQRALDHDDVLHWNTIDDPSLSPDGDWLTFVQTPMEGDPTLSLKAAAADGPALTVRGTGPTFTSDSRHLVFTAPAPESEVDARKREGKQGDDLPRDTLAVADIATAFADGEARLGGIRDLGPVESYEVAGEGSWVAYVPVDGGRHGRNRGIGDGDFRRGAGPAR